MKDKKISSIILTILLVGAAAIIAAIFGYSSRRQNAVLSQSSPSNVNPAGGSASQTPVNVNTAPRPGTYAS